MVLAYYRIDIAEPELRRLLKTRPSVGTHPIHLRNLQALGVSSSLPYPSTLTDLKALVDSGTPVIAFVWTAPLRDVSDTEGIDYLHAVIVVGFTAKDVLVHDPRLSDGPTQIPLKTFQDAWKYADHLIAVITKP